MRIQFVLSFTVILFNCYTVVAQNSISYEVEGSGQPVILLPGLGNSGQIWDDLVNVLSDNNTCYEITPNGFAGIPLEGEFSFDLIQEDIIRLIMNQKLENPILVGHSVGGFIALKIAIENPEVFSKLVIVDAYPYALNSINPSITLEGSKQQGLALKNMFINQSDEKFTKTEETILSMSITDPAKIERVLGWILSSNRDAIAEGTYLSLSEDLRDDLKNITSKTLIIGTWIGRKQFGFTKQSTEKVLEEQYKNLVDKLIVVSEDSKHFVMLDNPEWFHDQIISFIKE